MAEDAAHVPAGPLDPVTADRTLADVSGTDEPILMPGHVRAMSRSEADVELVGRQLTPMAHAGERRPVAVGSGSAEVLAAPSRGPVAEASPWRNPAMDVVDDVPRWSFVAPGHPEAPSAASPAIEDPLPSSSQPELPFPAATATPAAARPRPMPLFGPIGRLRSAVAVPSLAVITLGISALVWHHRVNRELELFDPKLHSRPGRSLVAVLIPWLAGLLVTLSGAALVLASRFGVQLPFDAHLTSTQAYYLLGGLALVPYLTLALPFSAVAVVMTLERLRAVEEHVGATTDRQVRPVAVSLLLTIPVVGGLVLLGVEQRRLNAVWQAVGPSGHLYS